MKTDICSRCAVKRQGGQRWYYIYPDLPRDSLPAPIAAYCVPCAKIVIPERVAARIARNSDRRLRRR